MSDHNELWEDVDSWITDHLIADDPAHEAAVAATDAGLPEIAVSPPQGRLLAIMVAAIGARRVLEIGCLGGYSAIWMAGALPDDGHLLSLELSDKHATVARSSIASAGLADRVEVRTGPASSTLRAMIAADEPPFDLVFIDADKAGYSEYLTLAMKLVRPGSLIIGDNATQRGAIIDQADDGADVVGMRRFLEQLGQDSRLKATVIQTAGRKGLDGLAIARVVAT